MLSYSTPLSLANAFHQTDVIQKLRYAGGKEKAESSQYQDIHSKVRLVN